jgi:predicted Zn-dependent protease
MTELTSVAQKAVNLAMRKGFDEAEAVCSKVIRREVIYRDKIEATKTNTIAGLSVRGILNKRVGFYSVSSLDPRELEKAVDQSLRIAKANQEDPDWHSLPTKYGNRKSRKWSTGRSRL